MKLCGILGKIEDRLIVLLTVIYTSLAVIEVFRRYLLNNSSSWGEELIRYLFIASVYIGCSSAVKYNAHIKIDAFVRLFKPKIQVLFLIVVQIVFMVFSILLIKEGVFWAIKQYTLGQVSPGLGIPIGVIYIIIPIGFTFITLRILETIYYLSKLLLLSDQEQIKQQLTQYEKGGL